MPAERFGLSQIGQIHVSVKDVDRAAAFYKDTLGLKFLFKFPGMAFFDAGGVRLFLSKPETPEFDRTSTIYYRVTDIGAAHSELQKRGVKFTEKPHIVHQDARHELWLAGFKDTEDNVVCLMSEVPKKS
jgi:predicted enzyme related to lactoylglutathione lyase